MLKLIKILLTIAVTITGWTESPVSAAAAAALKTDLSIGIEVVGGRMFTILGGGSELPAESKIFNITTNSNHQSKLPIRVFEGERAKTKDNILLGKFFLPDLPTNMAAGEVIVAVQLRVDEKDKEVTLIAWV